MATTVVELADGVKSFGVVTAMFVEPAVSGVNSVLAWSVPPGIVIDAVRKLPSATSPAPQTSALK